MNFYGLNALTHGVSKDLGIHSRTVQNVCWGFVRSRDARHKCPKFRVSRGSGRSLGWVPFQSGTFKTSGNSITYFGRTFKWFGIREWVCSNCGTSHDRDVNAARNILAIGLGAQPPVEESRKGI